MGDNQSPYTQPPPSPSEKPNLPTLYYGLVIIGTAAIVLAIYNLIIIRWWTRSRQDNSGQTPRRFTEATAGSRSFEQSNGNLLSSFKYRKENLVGVEHGCDYECAVCLSVFEEGEEVRQLPGCKHSFHAACIDMWLHSHSDCPLCRARVDPLPSFYRRHPVVDSTPDNSRDLLIGAAANAQFIPIV